MNEEKRTITVNRRDDAPDSASEERETAAEGAKEDQEVDWQAEAEKYRDSYVRTQAEMENMKKRLEREKADFVKYANDNLVKDLLPILDNLERALEHAKAEGENGQGLISGVQLTYDGFVSVLERFGVKAVSALGEKFDPNFHEAVMQKEDPDVEANTVIEQVQKGYLLNERLVRPALVVVSRKPAEENGD